MRPTLIYLGGNGHCAAQLGPGRQSLLQLVDADLAFGCSQGRFKGFAGQPVHTENAVVAGLIILVRTHRWQTASAELSALRPNGLVMPLWRFG